MAGFELVSDTRSRPRPTARNARTNPEHFTRRSNNIRAPTIGIGSKLNRTTGSVKSTTFHEERCIIASPRPRGDFDACIGEPVARLLSFACPLTRDLLDGVFIERLDETCVPSIRSLFFFLSSLGKGLDYDQRRFLFFIPSR